MVYGARISPLQFFLWITLTLLHLINTYCEVIDYLHFEKDSLISLIISSIQTALLLGSLLCHFFSEPFPIYVLPGEETQTKDDSKESPILNASIPSMLFFSWFTGFAWSGFKRSLAFEDLHELPPFIQSKNVVPTFLKNLNQPGKQVDNPETSGVKLDGVNEEVKIVPLKESPTKKSGILKTILKTFGSSLLSAMLLKLVYDVLVFITPLFLKRIIGYVGNSDEQLWKGVIYAIGLLIVSASQAILLPYYSIKMYMVGIWIRSSLTAALYRKSLKVSPQGKAQTTVGEVVNLMAVDTEKLVMLMVSNQLHV